MGLLDIFKTPNAGGAFPSQPKRGGFLGTGLDGEDVMNTLLRAASIAQGDYESGAQFGANIGARKRQREQQAQLESALSQANLPPEQAALARLFPDKAAEMLLRPPPEPKDPYRTEDNVGNVWEIGPDGQPKRIFTDTTPKYYVQGNQAVRISNPFTSGGAPMEPPPQAIADLKANPATAAQFDEIFGAGSSARYLGGGGSNAPGNFRP